VMLAMNAFITSFRSSMFADSMRRGRSAILARPSRRMASASSGAWGALSDQKVGPRRGEVSEPIQDGGDSWEHRDRMEGRGSGVNGDSAQYWR
jgi:hypothetical protein